MILAAFRHLSILSIGGVAGILFPSLMFAAEFGYRFGRRIASRKSEKSTDLAASATLTTGMIGLLAFTLSLSINFAQDRFEARRDLVLAEANAISTAWLRANLIDGAESAVIAAEIEEYARVALAYTTAESNADIPGLVERMGALQDGIWRSMGMIARHASNPVTIALASALNDMFDLFTSQRFAYQSHVLTNIVLMLYLEALATIGALGYQLGLGGDRHIVLTTLLLMMWSGGMILIMDLNQPRIGSIRADASPLIWTIRGFGGPAQMH
ncbi:hypothetical protein [Nguyenibacter sp. L1]|uniref:hypothetical protein n=1 Tax=Nguyenibacter sp. L1 TaxID=3049350 RepID=UPI002B470F8A|nr:hypothetical protein [Nguyenibacter sp. L1]WRH87009.1 hypothetical protein QN315_13570 [Nguyenibacter sp. L1]